MQAAADIAGRARLQCAAAHQCPYYILLSVHSAVWKRIVVHGCRQQLVA
jgi:hypothetical protein